MFSHQNSELQPAWKYNPSELINILSNRTELSSEKFNPENSNTGYFVEGKNSQCIIQALQTFFEKTIYGYKTSWQKRYKDVEIEPPFVQDYREHFLDAATREWNWLMETWEKADKIDIQDVSAIYYKIQELNNKLKHFWLNIKENPKRQSVGWWGKELERVTRHIQISNDQFGNILVPKTCKIQLPCEHGDYYTNVEIGLNKKGEPMIVKHIKPSVLRELRQILASVRRLYHKHVLSYYLTDGSDSVLVMPLMNLNLGQYIMYLSSNNRLANKAHKIVYQIIDGLVFLHKTNHPPIIHGNLKPTNIFIDKNYQIRLADFGLNYKSKPSEISLIWKSMEQVRDHRNGEPCRGSLSSDVASAGLLMYFVLTAGRHPFGVTVPEILDNLADGNFELNTSDAVTRDLLTNMLTSDVTNRPDISEVTRHIFWWPLSKRWAFVSKLIETDRNPNHETVIQYLIKSTASLVFKNDQAILYSKGGARDTQQDMRCFFQMLQKKNLIHEIQQQIPNLPLYLYQFLKPTHWAQATPLKPFFDSRHF